MIRDVTDLRVYTRALNALRLVYQLAKLIPNSHFKLRKQLTSAAESIAPLIAEGFAKRRSYKEFMRFLEMALGSSDEVITHARQTKILSEIVRSINPNLCDQVIKEYKIISKQVNTLRKKWVDNTKI